MKILKIAAFSALALVKAAFATQDSKWETFYRLIEFVNLFLLLDRQSKVECIHHYINSEN